MSRDVQEREEPGSGPQHKLGRQRTAEPVQAFGALHLQPQPCCLWRSQHTLRGAVPRRSRTRKSGLEQGYTERLPEEHTHSPINPQMNKGVGGS